MRRLYLSRKEKKYANNHNENSKTTNSYINYTGDVDRFLNMPIVVNENPIGTIIKVINETDDYIEVEGYLWTAGVNYFDRPEGLIPADVTILIRNINPLTQEQKEKDREELRKCTDDDFLKCIPFGEPERHK